MINLLSLIFWFFLVIATVFLAVALFISIVHENDKEKAKFKPQPVREMSYGLSKWELDRITWKVMRNDKKRRRYDRPYNRNY